MSPSDDGPVAVNDVTSQGAEDAAVIYNVLNNDTPAPMVRA
ncbi:hypothetical protein [Gallaecimonas pentaromativorans]